MDNIKKPIYIDICDDFFTSIQKRIKVKYMNRFWLQVSSPIRNQILNPIKIQIYEQCEN